MYYLCTLYIYIGKQFIIYVPYIFINVYVVSVSHYLGYTKDCFPYAVFLLFIDGRMMLRNSLDDWWSNLL